MPADRVVTLEVGLLDATALHHVVQSHLGLVLPRPVLDDVRDASGGNPFYALEIVRTLQRSGISVDRGQPLPVPESLHDLVHGRLRALPSQSRDFLLAAAAYAHPTIAVTEAASGIDREAGLRPALEARIIELDKSRIRFTHPLLAAGAYETADRARRAEIHARLAELLDDPEARAWQLAASIGAPDEAVADALEDAAQHARRRGAPRSAAQMLDRASQLTPSDLRGDALRRAVDAAYLHFESGDSRRAEAQLRDAIAPLAPGPDRARATVILARIRLYEAPDEANELFAQVVTEAEGDRETLAVAHEGFASCSFWMFKQLDEGLRHSEVALALALEIGDEALAADVLITLLRPRRCWADPPLRRRPTGLRHFRTPRWTGASSTNHSSLLPSTWKWVDSHERARAVLVDLMRHAHDLGDENAPPWLLFLLGDVERLLGNLEAALDCARTGQEAADQSGQPLFARHNLALEALVQAQLGRPTEARDAARRMLGAPGDNYGRIMAAEALGHLGFVLGTPEEAVAQLEPPLAVIRREAIAEPGVTRFAVDLIEALVELGRSDEAIEILDWYEGNARRLERASALANCRRCRGLLASGDGELEAALVVYEEALALHDRAEIPLDRGRTLLALGAAQRRVKRRREARATLEQALALFEKIGAALWAERARGELRRISGRAPTTGALTPAEERVAALVVQGKTNREVAAALFLSDRTVEGHLSRIFGKLGIRHRTELARALATRQTQGIAESNTGDSPVSADPIAP